MAELPDKFVPLYRYTSFASAIDILKTGCLTLLSPHTWDDRNDCHFIDSYLERTGHNSAFALCFTKASETSHHWASFARSGDGVRLKFDRKLLEKDIFQTEGVVLRDVSYHTVNGVRALKTRVEEWPFAKRYPYRGEEETRLFYSCSDEDISVVKVPISDGTLKEFVLSPNLPEALKQGMVELVRHASSFSSLRVFRSTLFENERWMKTIL